MKVKLYAIALLLFAIVLVDAGAGESRHDHNVVQTVAFNDAPIHVIINPEARVRAALTGKLPPPVLCGTPVELAVAIVNQGFVTANLEVRFVGDAPPGVMLDMRPEPLTGLPQETRMLRITLAKAVPTDLTIAFRTHNEIPDVGGRDRVHFLLHCRLAA